MRKPQGYDEAQVYGEFTPLKAGGHKLVILGTKEQVLKGYEVLTVQFDTAKDDVQPNYFRDSFAADTRENKKYNGQANVFLTRKNEHGKMVDEPRALKTLITAIERSNQGFTYNWDVDPKQLVGKRVGGVFGEEEYRNPRGGISTSVKLLRYGGFRSIDKIEDVEVPKKKTLEPEPPIAPVDADGFMTIPDSLDEELPFV